MRKNKQQGPVVNLNVALNLQELMDKINAALGPHGYQLILIKLPAERKKEETGQPG